MTDEPQPQATEPPELELPPLPPTIQQIKGGLPPVDAAPTVEPNFVEVEMEEEPPTLRELWSSGQEGGP